LFPFIAEFIFFSLLLNSTYVFSKNNNINNELFLWIYSCIVFSLDPFSLRMYFCYSLSIILSSILCSSPTAIIFISNSFCRCFGVVLCNGNWINSNRKFDINLYFAIKLWKFNSISKVTYQVPPFFFCCSLLLLDRFITDAWCFPFLVYSFSLCLEMFWSNSRLFEW